MFLNRLNSVVRAVGVKTTGVPKEGRNEPLINPMQKSYHPTHYSDTAGRSLIFRNADVISLLTSGMPSSIEPCLAIITISR